MSTEPVLTQHKVTVLLIDDQPMIGEAVRRMLAGEPDIVFHYNRDAGKALDEADRLKPTVILQDLVMPDIDGLTLVKDVPGPRTNPRDAFDRALDQGRANRQGRGICFGRQRLYCQASRPARAPWRGSAITPRAISTCFSGMRPTRLFSRVSKGWRTR